MHFDNPQQQDERQSLKFYDVTRLDDEEVMYKSSSLSSFTATLLRDPRVVQCLGEAADVINDPDGVFVHGPNAAEALSDAATIPADCHPRDHWAPSFFLCGPTGCIAAVTSFQRDADNAEWVPHRCAGVELVPKDGEPIVNRTGASRHGLKYVTRFA